MKKIFTLSIFLLLIFQIDSFAITPNANISRGKTTYTSSGNKTYLTDNVFNGSTFSIYNGAWFAINVGSGPSKVFFNWNTTGYSWSDVIASAGSCKNSLTMPQNYTIQTSSNSTNGSDGSWTTEANISGNSVTSRGHVVNFSGKSWIRMSVSTGGGSMDEIQVFNQSSGGDDSWFFPGTSITANTYKGTPPSQNFADIVNQKNGSYTPIMIRGGIPCINSTQFANDISKYLANAGNVKYWAIEMGTNDAWGGSNGGVNTFKNNMQTVITACKNAGIIPMIASLISTNQSAAGWQVHPDYLSTIATLNNTNGLVSGPDLYTYFGSHPSELNSDGVHPNATGAASIQRLWADKVASLYSGTTGAGAISNGTYQIIFKHSGKSIVVENAQNYDGANVIQNPYSGTNNEKWFVQDIGSGQYSIKNVNATGRGLDVVDASTASPADINLWYYWGGNNQKWKIEAVGSYYRIVNVNSSKCLEMPSNNQGNVSIGQWDCNGGDNQLFTFTKLNSNTSREAVEFEEETVQNAFEVYPNPSTGSFTVKEAGVFEYTITNTTGSTLEKGNGIDLVVVGKNLVAGIYFLQINSAQGTKQVKLLKE